VKLRKGKRSKPRESQDAAYGAASTSGATGAGPDGPWPKAEPWIEVPGAFASTTADRGVDDGPAERAELEEQAVAAEALERAEFEEALERAAAERVQIAEEMARAAAERAEIAQERERAAAELVQIAEAREKATGERVEAVEVMYRAALARSEIAEAKEKAAAERDSIANARDRAATERDTIANARDKAAIEREAIDREAIARSRLVASQDGDPHDGVDSELERARLEALLQRAHLDALTGAFRREMGRLALRNEIDRARRADGSFVIAFIDVDGLKGVNDRNGHAAGDRVLRMLVAIMRANLRSYDPIVRFGGDEFLCGIASVDPGEVQHRIGVIDQSLRNATGVGITAGLASLTSNESLDELTARADAALLEAKKARGE
jgi:diguanylate cyclase (GGDEF)-like protein